MEPYHIGFPSILQYRNIIQSVKQRAKHHRLPVPSLEFTGTVKLHGTNASVFIALPPTATATATATATETQPEALAAAPQLWVQSRNRILTPQNDNFGFATHVEVNAAAFQELLAIARTVYEKGAAVGEDDYLGIYGEWCGEQIQKGVALTGLPKMFVIFGIRVKHGRPVVAEEENEEDETKEELETDPSYWFTPDQLTAVTDEFGRDRAQQHSVYCIHHFPTWKLAIDFAKPEVAQNQLCQLTAAVEAECPVGKHFGVSGIGEGIVWAATPGAAVPYRLDDLVFKVKGAKHSEKTVICLAPVCVEKIENIKVLAAALATEHRLEKKVEEMLERGMVVDVKSTSHFLSIVRRDVMREEGDTIKASGLPEKEVLGALSKRASQWFLTRVQGLT